MIKFFWAIRALQYKLLMGKVGRLCYMGKPLFLSNPKRIFIGNKVRIFPHFRMEVLDSNSSIVIHDNVSIGQNFHVISGASLHIGTGTTISANVLITNVDHSYADVSSSVMSQSLIVKETTVGDNCFLGVGSVLQAGTCLGSNCVVGANSVVKGVFPERCVIAGVPAKIIKLYDSSTQVWKTMDK
ncbi:acyltransferase [Alginatibacterium sediminis]|nr:acyltransferase [Alginatibacterium sediminis]